MKLSELGEEYMSSAQLCRERAAELRRELKNVEHTAAERILLKRRVATLDAMVKDTAAIGSWLLNYYREDVSKNEDTKGRVSGNERLSQGSFSGEKQPRASYENGYSGGADAAASGDGAHVLFGAAYDEGDCRDAGSVSLYCQSYTGRGAQEAKAMSALWGEEPATR